MKLSEARAMKLFTAARLATEAGVSRGSIYAVEGGKWLPSLEMVRKLSGVLEIDPTEVDEFKAAMEKTARGKEVARAIA